MSAKEQLRIDFTGVDKTAAALRGIGNKITGFATKAAASLAGIFAIKAMATGTKNLVMGLHDIGDAAQKIGIDPEVYQRFGAALQQVGYEAEDASAFLMMMKKNIASKGDDKNNIFGRMGMDFATLKAMDPMGQFQAIGQQISKLGNETDRVTALVEIFGKSGGQLAPLFRQGPEAFIEGLQGVMGMVNVAGNDTVAKAGMIAEAFKSVGTAMQADLASAFLAIAGYGENSFGRIDVAIFAAYQKVKLFVQNTFELFGWLKDAAMAIFTDKTFADMTSLSDRFVSNIEEADKAIADYKAGVNAKDKLATGFKDAIDGAINLKSKVQAVQDSIRNFGKMELAGTYAMIQAKYGGLAPQVGGGFNNPKVGAMGGARNPMMDRMVKALTNIEKNTSKTAENLEDLEEF